MKFSMKFKQLMEDNPSVETDLLEELIVDPEVDYQQIVNLMKDFLTDVTDSFISKRTLDIMVREHLLEDDEEEEDEEESDSEFWLDNDDDELD